jgi:hypothetical protein
VQEVLELGPIGRGDTARRLDRPGLVAACDLDPLRIPVPGGCGFRSGEDAAAAVGRGDEVEIERDQGARGELDRRHRRVLDVDLEL